MKFFNLFRKPCRHEMVYHSKEEGVCVHGQVITKYQGICRLCGMVSDKECIIGHDSRCIEHVIELIRLGCAAKQRRETNV